MFTSLLDYYLKNAQDRINERIEDINKERSALRSSGSSLYSDLKPIRNSHLYEHKQLKLFENLIPTNYTKR